MSVARVWLVVVFVAWTGSAEASLEEALLIYEDADGVGRESRTEPSPPKKVAFIAPKFVPRHREHVPPSIRQLRHIAIREAVTHRVPPDLFLAIISVESSWRQSAIGQADEISLVQMLPSTFEDLRTQGLVRGDPWHPPTNLHAGAVYLQQIIDAFTKADLRFGYRKLGLTPYAMVAAAYNAGPYAVKESMSGRRKLPASTRVYSQMVHAQSRREQESLRKG